jgi:hypothetical protein
MCFADFKKVLFAHLCILEELREYDSESSREGHNYI